MKAFIMLIFISLAMLWPLDKVAAQFIPAASNYNEMSLLFSKTTFEGSARIQGLGGAQVALGGDISNNTSNPAGLGFFNRSEFSFTPSLNFLNNQTSYFGLTSEESAARFNFSNIGVILNNTKDDIVPGKWRGGSFGISVNQINDFNNRIFYEGNNDISSILDYFHQASVGIPESEISQGGGLVNLAYYSYLINPEYLFVDQGFDDIFYPITADEIVVGEDRDDYQYFLGNTPRQAELIETRGGQYQWSFGYGGNYNDKIYFGASLGLVTLNYVSEKTFSESFEPTDITPDLDFDVIEETRVNGSGINGTFGVIVRPHETFRIGASVVTPTFYNIDDERTPVISYDFNGYQFTELNDTTLQAGVEEGDLFISEYRLRTPMKINGGASYFFGKNGFITGEVEYVNYSSIHMSSDDFEPGVENRYFDNSLQNVINYRIGGEYRYDIFRVRAGYAYQDSPYADESLARTVNDITFGLGVRTSKFYADLAVVNRSFSSSGSYIPYYLDQATFPFEGSPVASIDTNMLSTSLSLGFFF